MSRTQRLMVTVKASLATIMAKLQAAKGPARYPAGTMIGNENVGGQFMPKDDSGGGGGGGEDSPRANGGAASKLPLAMQDLKDKAESSMNRFLSSLGERSEGFRDGLTNSLDDIDAKLKGIELPNFSASESGKKLKDGLLDAAKKAGFFAEDAIDAMKEGFDAKFGDPKQAFEDAKGSLSDFVKSQKTALKETQGRVSESLDPERAKKAIAAKRAEIVSGTTTVVSMAAAAAHKEAEKAQAAAISAAAKSIEALLGAEVAKKAVEDAFVLAESMIEKNMGPEQAMQFTGRMISLMNMAAMKAATAGSGPLGEDTMGLIADLNQHYSMNVAKTQYNPLLK